VVHFRQKQCKGLFSFLVEQWKLWNDGIWQWKGDDKQELSNLTIYQNG
jgi:hypothetical protein